MGLTSRVNTMLDRSVQQLADSVQGDAAKLAEQLDDATSLMAMALMALAGAVLVGAVVVAFSMVKRT
jgi:hypothetical protein